MDKSLLIFIAVGIAFIYFITNFIGDIQQEDEKFQSSTYHEKHRYDQFNAVDSIGQEILDVTGQPESVQIAAWNNSHLRHELKKYFPDFSTMKLFAKERVRGDILKMRLYKHIDSIEGKFFSGDINAEQAKKELDTLK